MTRDFDLGDHVCALYENEQELLAIAAGYVADGLREDERCLFVARTPDVLERFQTALDSFGITASRMVKQGALVLATNAQTHLCWRPF